ncbi:hypothetical protein N7931_12595 [Catenovulum sp. 2E275]|uniref:hypothetical protein n=1 Tax=Catenovulum sp. 2E275 TaxID=2980497 RepID=UPI0021D02D63|nr:hypothetical protein [Catenovulum sp. 2E275]MCU4676469.1 hypothetical protein [Catenovulum sp. 2E275]
MKKLTPILLASLFSASCLAANSQNIYQCVNKQTFEQDAACVANLIADNQEFKIELESVNQQAANLDNDKVLSLMRMNPNDLSIEVIALSEEVTEQTESKKL